MSPPRPIPAPAACALLLSLAVPCLPVASQSATTEGRGPASDHWAFQPIDRPSPPATRQHPWVRNPIDAFILDRLEQAGLEPSPAAPPRALFRRACFDLTGLPPTPRQMEEFLANPSPRAFQEAVEDLLASPHYGERWGRHWLDVVRYGESNSYERDNPKPFVWRYRDYVVASFNQDKPFDQFIREQLAGDERSPTPPEAIIATGFYRLGIWDDEPTDRLQARYDELDDILTTTSQAFLGLTLNCARCHDHKLDPLTQKDYYSLLAFFHNLRPMETRGDNITADIPGPAEQAARAREVAERKQARAANSALIASFESRILQAAQGEGSVEETDPERRARLIDEFIDQVLSPAERKGYQAARQKREELDRSKVQPFPKALCVKEQGREAPETFVLRRGNAHAPGRKVAPAFPAVLGFPPPEIPPLPDGIPSSGRRTVLADWIASPGNPLTARVIVNRLWHYHFGRGLVATPNDFGTAGDPPTHPALLDWLAAEFIGQGWSLKALHRLIMDSNTYRMASSPHTHGLELDPENRWLWRFPMRRLSAEEVRDAILQVNGTLNRKLAGPSIYPDLPREVLQTQSRPGHNWGQSSEAEQNRRSLYIHVKRSLLLPLMTAFDFANPDTTCPVRFSTTQPTQALTLLNSDFIREQSGRLAGRLAREAGPEPSDQVRLGFRLALARDPDPSEVRRGVELIESMRRLDHLEHGAALRRFCLLLYNLNEFVYLP